MDEARKERLARNEAAFRKVNEAIEPGRRRGGGERIAFVCECGALGCNRLLELSVDEYEDVRSDARHFFVLPGHEEPEVEFVVDGHDRYHVVQKRDDTAGIAEETDPRA